ncbi:MAG: DUF488 domain-containing protein [Phycisphaerae bacterium]
MRNVRIKRVYLPVLLEDGARILVERLWPRGITKEKAAIDCWLKEIAPSAELRKWFGHDPDKWAQFRRRYREELKANSAAVNTLRQWIRKGTVTLVYAARDEEHNSAVVLSEFLDSQSSTGQVG